MESKKIFFSLSEHEGPMKLGRAWGIPRIVKKLKSQQPNRHIQILLGVYPATIYILYIHYHTLLHTTLKQ
jgi:hypothetical protein